jgi:8-oxo-dGTP pyrophosphatase MutT (NUDIX family)
MRDSFNGVIAIVYKKEKSAVLKKEKTLFLIIHNKSTGNKTFVAGARKRKEASSLDTLRREVKEETGMEVSEYNIEKTPYIHEFTYNKKKKLREGEQARQLVFLVEKKSKKRLLPIDPDSEVLGWFTEKDVLKKLTFNDAKELFKKVLKLMKE